MQFTYFICIFASKTMVKRIIEKDIIQSIGEYPVTAIVGARQVGKTTLAKKIIKNFENGIYLDLERNSHRVLLQTDPEKYFLINNNKLICIDEIQLLPDIFPLLRSLVDIEEYKTRFLILGSASPELLRQSSESLAGRIIYFTLTPFLLPEINTFSTIQKYHLKGGFPRSYLSKSEKSAFLWLDSFINTFLERDLNSFGFNLPADLMRRLWRMLAHNNGQLLNSSRLGNSIGLSHTTIRRYIDILRYTYMIRILEPYYTNIKKRIVKTPKIYIIDTGILHSLLKISTFDDLFNHPVYGSSFESLVIENVIASFNEYDPYFYRNSNGNEIDLLLVKGQNIIAIEIKASTSPKINKGFYIACDDIKATQAFVIADIEMTYPLKNNVMVYNLKEFLKLPL